MFWPLISKVATSPHELLEFSRCCWHKMGKFQNGQLQIHLGLWFILTKMNHVQVMLVSLIWVHIPSDQFLFIRHLAMSGYLASFKPYQKFKVQHTRCMITCNIHVWDTCLSYIRATFYGTSCVHGIIRKYCLISPIQTPHFCRQASHFKLWRDICFVSSCKCQFLLALMYSNPRNMQWGTPIPCHKQYCSMYVVETSCLAQKK